MVLKLTKLATILFLALRWATAAVTASSSCSTDFDAKSGLLLLRVPWSITPMTFNSREKNNPLLTTSWDGGKDAYCDEHVITTLDRFRGGGDGGISLSRKDDDDNDDTPSALILTRVRNAIRGILKFGDDTIPSVSKIFRSCFRMVEKLTGVDLLPSKIKSKKKTKNNKKQSKPISTSTENDVEIVDEEKKKSDKNSSPATKVLKKPSATTKKHVSTSIKPTNPNFRIQKELKSFIQDPPPNLSVQVGTNIRIWVVTMVGANNTIYEGEVFKLRIKFPKDYPTVPPSVYFIKPHIPKHEHVYTNGDICLSLLGKDWRPTMTAQSVANSILSILSSASSKTLPMDNAAHADAKPGEYQKDWIYHDDNC